MKVRKATPADKHTLQDLILHRVHEILLIASPYDAFVLEEDGGLTEQILHEYIGMSFGNAPRIWRAETAADAMKMLTETQFNRNERLAWPRPLVVRNRCAVIWSATRKDRLASTK